MRILVSGGTKTVRRLAAEWPDHLGHLLTPGGGNRASVLDTNLPIAVDNGAFSGFDPVSFRHMLRRLADWPRILWVACPDRVADSQTTLELFWQWQGEIRLQGFPVAFVAQDGCEKQILPWQHFQCLFLGGTTRWKLSPHAALLAAAGKAYGKQVHMGRVNSLRRLWTAYDIGCDSVDGKSFNRFGDTYLLWALRYLRRLERQRTMF